MAEEPRIAPNHSVNCVAFVAPFVLGPTYRLARCLPDPGSQHCVEEGSRHFSLLTPYSVTFLLDYQFSLPETASNRVSLVKFFECL